LLPRSTEIQPLSLRFVPPNPHVAYHTREPKGLKVINAKGGGVCYALERKDLAIKTPRGPDLHYLSRFSTHFYLTGLVQMEERALSFAGKSQRGAFAHQKCCARTTLRLRIHSMCCVGSLFKGRAQNSKRPPALLQFCTLWSKNQNKSRRGRNATNAYRPCLCVVIDVSATY